MTRRSSRRWRLTTTAAAAALAAGSAGAFQFDAPEDWSIRWDNTVKASTKYRLRDADPALSQSFIGGNPANGPQALNFNGGDQNFQQKGIVSERLDLLSEFDAVWRRDFGVRVSAAGWYDHKIRGTTDATDPFVGQTPVNEFPAETRRKAGRKAELLDAFVFGGWRFGAESKLTARLGRHGLQYGESLFFGDNGIARAQGPIDIDKLLASPGAQFKEIIRPVPQLSSQLQISPDLSVGGYYQFQWEEDRLPPSGTYFSSANIPWGSYQPEVVGLNATTTFLLTPGGDNKPKNSGQFGVQAKWRIGETDLGAYFARYHDKGGQLYGRLNFAGAPNAFGQLPGQWYYKFPEGIRTWGLSASRSIGDFNLAAEASIRQNMPLRSTNMLYGFPTPVGFTGEPQYAVGKTAHVNFSWLASLGPNFLSQESSFLGELAWNRVLSKYDPAGELDSGRTRDATAIRMIFSPSYRQALPGLDLSVPVGLGYTLRGNSSVTAWGAEDTGDFSIGLEGNYLGVWQAALSYTKYIGKAVPFVDYTGTATYGRPIYGLGNALADRDFISLSIRRTF
jgi:hypothetical protein